MASDWMTRQFSCSAPTNGTLRGWNISPLGTQPRAARHACLPDTRWSGQLRRDRGILCQAHEGAKGRLGRAVTVYHDQGQIAMKLPESRAGLCWPLDCLCQ